MGNAASAPRTDFLQRDDRRFHEIHQRNDRSRSPVADNGRSSRLSRRRTVSPRPAPPEMRQNAMFEGLRRNASDQSIAHQTLEGTGLDESAYEQEERPLVDMEERGMEATPNAAPSALLRRQSTMSRLGSRLLPDSLLRNFPGPAEESSVDFRAHPTGASARTPSTSRDHQASQSGSRFSLRESLRQRTATRLEPRRNLIRGPFPLGLVDRDIVEHDSEGEVRTNIASSRPDALENTVLSWRRRARLSRVRDSIALPLQNIFSQAQDRPPTTQASRGPPGRPARVTFADDADHLLPPLNGLDHRLDLDDAPHELDAVEPETRNLLSSSRVTQGMSTIRRFPHGLRSRSTRLIRRGEHPPLSQVLQLAAAAIAAQLSGHANPSGNGIRTLGGDTFDGSIQNFVQTLQDAASAQAGENIDLNAAEGDLPPVNFMRVFQFPNDENGAPITSQGQSRDPDSMDIDNIAGQAEGDRSVTLVLVGVRSMPHGHEGGGDGGTIGPSLDTLFSLPFLHPTNMMQPGNPGTLIRRSEGRSRLASRRHSMTNFNFPAQYESQRHQRTRNSTARNSTEHPMPAHLSDPTVSLPSVLSESPPGPHPPPSTPADLRSGEATPIRRPSSVSGVRSPSLSDLEEGQDQHATAPPPELSFQAARQRRRSDSEFARRPELSSGAARRNGVVEPDHPPPGTGRSWLIYVVGTNVSSDHPAFTMPSLFTDNPSYEDMQMLSTLLGPVKPPVATQEDVSSAGGVFRLVLRSGELAAEPLAGNSLSAFSLGGGERCLICLCDYEASEELRQLAKCQHVYHRECIDEWLLTGRNNCPLCRGQGVGETSTASNPTPEPA